MAVAAVCRAVALPPVKSAAYFHGYIVRVRAVACRFQRGWGSEARLHTAMYGSIAYTHCSGRGGSMGGPGWAMPTQKF